jgi:hypothetical protein
MWFSVTPKKMCESCGKAGAPEFQFLKNMSRYYGLVKEDLKDVPTILRISKSSISLTDLVSPTEGTIMNHSRSKEESILVECIAIKELASTKQREWKHKGMGFDYGNAWSRLRIGFSEIGYRIHCCGTSNAYKVYGSEDATTFPLHKMCSLCQHGK